MDRNIKRRDQFPALLNDLNLNGNWVELGVAKGHYSKVLLDRGKSSMLWSIDRWSDHHDIKQYFGAMSLFRPHHAKSTVVRASFEEVVDQFKNNYFDFIYIDGYAHTGQNGGSTLNAWYPKLKKGGVFAGHDYHQKWQPTIVEVDKFFKNKSLKLNLTPADEFPSWWTIKP